MKIVQATEQDIPELISLMQSSYRGNKGWCRDTHLLEGKRVTREMLEKDFITGQTWKCIPSGDDGEGQVGEIKDDMIIASVYIEKEVKTNTLFIGRLCVHPDYQTRGLGKKMMKAMEERARSEKCSGITLQVVVARKNLIEWYERQGFRLTGERMPMENGVYDNFLVEPEMMDLVTLQKNF